MKEKIIDLVHGYPPRLERWTMEDIRRASQHVWEQIRPQTREELEADIDQIFVGTNMTSEFRSKITYTLLRGSENSLRLSQNETGERLQIRHRFACGRIVMFDLRMQSQDEVLQAFINAQQQTPETVW